MACVNGNALYLGSDIGTMLSYLKDNVYNPEFTKYLNKRVLLNIFKEYKNLILKGFKPLKSDKPLPAVHFTPVSWVTIRLLTKNTGIHKHFILSWCEALYKLSITGKITYSNLDPTKTEKSEFIEEIKKAFKGMKIALPVAVTAGVIISMFLLKK